MKAVNFVLGEYARYTRAFFIVGFVLGVAASLIGVAPTGEWIPLLLVSVMRGANLALIGFAIDVVRWAIRMVRKTQRYFNACG